MVRNQDDSSFLSWSATLHPESAVSSIDPQTANTWATAYHETCSDAIFFENMPVALDVVAIHDDPEEANTHQPQDATNATQQQQDDSSYPASSPQGPYRPQPWKHSNLIDLILGATLALGAVLFTIKIELTAIIIYTLAAGCHYVAEEMLSASVALLPKSICAMLMAIFMVLDSILLTVSVFVTEILGAVAFLLCGMFGGPKSGQEWHQFIRRACHLTRWGFRRCHEGWKPDRVFPISMEEEQEGCMLPVSQDEEEAESERELPGMATSTLSSTHGYYRDDVFPNRLDHDSSTLVSAITYDVTLTVEDSPPISISPENVQVLHPDDAAEGSDGCASTAAGLPSRYQEDHHEDDFVKNTQQVVMT